MNRMRVEYQGAHSIVEARVWTAWVNVSGEVIEGRGSNREDAILDLIDRLVDRLERRSRP